eukprot:5925171-Amphidinium_carterae.1
MNGGGLVTLKPVPSNNSSWSEPRFFCTAQTCKERHCSSRGLLALDLSFALMLINLCDACTQHWHMDELCCSEEVSAEGIEVLEILAAKGTIPLKNGDAVALAGPGGSGKTALLQAISGRPPDALALRVTFARDVRRLALLGPTALRLGGEPFLGSVPTAVQAPACRTASVVSEFLRECGLSSDRFHKDVQHIVQEVERGLRQVLVWQPDILLLDDATQDLPVDIVTCVTVVLQNMLSRRECRTILVASHDRDLMDAVCSKTLVFEDGNIFLSDGSYTRYLRRSGRLQFSHFTLQQPESVGLKATQAACAFASLAASVLGRLEGLRVVDVGSGTGVSAS